MRKLKGFTLIELMIVVAIIGILAALAIPNFMRFQAKSKQSEAKANLKSIFTAQKSYAAEKDQYGTTFNDIGFEPERGNRYAYYLMATSTPEDRSAETIPNVTNATTITVDTYKYSGATAAPTFAVGTASPTLGATTDDFTARAAGNIDSEATGVDSWEISTISTDEGATCGNNGENFVAGTPYNTYNDVSCD